MNINTSKSTSNALFSILVIDDSNIIEKPLQNLLEENYQTTFTDNISDAMELLENKEFETIILNLTHSTINEHQTIQNIFNHFQNLTTPIIILNDTNNHTEIKEFHKIGVSHIHNRNSSYELLATHIDYWSNHYKKMKQLVKQQHILQEYKDTVDASNIVSKTDNKGIITYVNHQFCIISGYSADELIGKPHNIIRHPDMPSIAFEDMWEKIKSKKIWRGKVKNRTKNGGVYYVDTTIKPIVDNNGEIIEFIGIRKDITELEEFRQQLENELNLKEEDLQEVIKRSREYHKAMDESTILARTDLNGKITYINHEFTLALGYTNYDILGKDHNIMKHPDTPKVIIKNLWDTILKGKTWKGMIKNLNKYGETVWLDTVIVPIKNMQDETVEYLTIRHNVSEIIHLNEEIETTQGELIYTLGAAAETRSRETGNHIKRVAHYSKLLALLSGIQEQEANILYQASPMHDIGKLGIPDHILKKPGRLTEEERDIMNTHSELGYNILKTSTRAILQAAATVAYEHHEKWDGSGYPRSLKNEDIHIYGRITAIADVFDALGSERVYKKAWEDEDIFEYLKKESGKQFDPKLIKLFFDNLDQFLEIRNQFNDV